MTDWRAEDLWRAYIQLTEAEAAFGFTERPGSAPVWHQKQERVEAHILVCFLAYVLWKALAQTCRGAGLGDEPRKVLEELSRVALVEIALPTRTGVTIRNGVSAVRPNTRRSCCSGLGCNCEPHSILCRCSED